jgi:hypothetical protein
MVMVNGPAYLVDLGPKFSLRFHTVNKDKTCSCGQVRCAAIKAVEDHLRRGGQRAPESAPHSLQPPAGCPICGAPVRVVSYGWMCTADRLHYWQYRTQRLRAAREQYLNSLPDDVRRYWAEILHAFEPGERAKFLAVHALKYPASD